MLKSPEEYLSNLSFDPPEDISRTLSSGEKIFIEKYLGLEAFERLPEFTPDKGSLLFQNDAFSLDDFRNNASDNANLHPTRQNASAKNKSEFIPEVFEDQEKSILQRIQPAGFTKIEDIPANLAQEQQKQPQLKDNLSKVTVKEPEEQPQIAIAAPQPPEGQAAAEITDKKTAKIELKSAKTDTGHPATSIEGRPQKVKQSVIEQTPKFAQQIKDTEQQSIKAVQKKQEVDIGRKRQSVSSAARAPVAKNQPTPPNLREKLKTEAEIQMVSFLTAGQKFLLPVMSIQEVLRHQELIKVPQAPQFVAGVINLRGHVMPVVYLSALLTNATEHPYSERNFIIVCGTEQFRMGLIIDRISSMHILPQNAIIWNVESKLGDSAEFLCAIANLDDKVCGIVEPDTIAQKILEP